ncbi:uncharacterized protein G2W53_017896 [Senna tora]|uniref:Uncharacterized protein n=1 Tax=Senna tora TaxID=362788 RepID=A0A834WKW2_9FABA|nr:uncharacterized protein G2W53_017896 [Senna tora]
MWIREPPREPPLKIKQGGARSANRELVLGV